MASRSGHGGDELQARPVDARAVLSVVGSRSRRRVRKILLWVVVLLSVAVAVVAVRKYMNRPAAPPSYMTETVERGDIDETVDATGTLEAKRVVSVGGEISGRVATVEVDINDQVEAGQVLATLDPASLDNALTEARGTLATSKIEVNRANAALEAAEVKKERAEQLWKQGLVSREELDTALNEHRLAKADAARAKSERSLAGVRVEQAQTNKAKATIEAPIDGVVLSRSVEPGNAIAASLEAPELFELAEDLRAMRLELGVDEADVGRVREGQSATFTVDAWPGKTFDAKVERVHLAPDSTTSSAVVTYTAVLAVDNADGLLRPGMTATATILVERHEDVLRIPTAALRFDPAQAAQPAESGGGGPGGPFGMPRPPMQQKKKATESAPSAGTESVVHVLRDGQLVPARVSTGASDGRWTAVDSSELSVGDAVVVGVQRQMQGPPQMPGGGAPPR